MLSSWVPHLPSAMVSHVGTTLVLLVAQADLFLIYSQSTSWLLLLPHRRLPDWRIHRSLHERLDRKKRYPSVSVVQRKTGIDCMTKRHFFTAIMVFSNLKCVSGHYTSPCPSILPASYYLATASKVSSKYDTYVTGLS